MEKITIVAIVIVVILLIIIIYNLIVGSIDISCLLKGFYQAPPIFCANAGVDSFLLYINGMDIDDQSFNKFNKLFKQPNKPNKPNKKHTGYILSTQGQNMIINELIDFSVKWENKSLKNIFLDGYICGEWEMSKIAHIPSCLSIKFYPFLGKIILHKDKTTYAIVYRSPETTELLFESNTTNIEPNIESLKNEETLKEEKIDEKTKLSNNNYPDDFEEISSSSSD